MRLGERRVARRRPRRRAPRDRAARSRQRRIVQPGLGERTLDERSGRAARRCGLGAGSSMTTPGRAAARSPARNARSDRIQRQRDAGAVTRLAIGPERAAVGQRGQTGERQRQDPVARPAAGVRDEPDAARVVLEARVVQRRRDRATRRGALRSRWSVSMVLASPEGRSGRCREVDSGRQRSGADDEASAGGTGRSRSIRPQPRRQDW